MQDIKILIAQSEAGAGTRGASLGPDAVLITAVEKGFKKLSEYPVRRCEFNIEDVIFEEADDAKNIYQIQKAMQNCCSAMKEILESGQNVLVLSGDHSNAAGLVSGVKDTYPEKRVGLIWIDAHGDLHSPYTSPSGNMHGMPIGLLLGLDNREEKIRDPNEATSKIWEDLKTLGDHNISPKIKAADLVFIDIRDLEPQEWALLDRMEIKYFTPERRKEIGINNIIDQTLKHLQYCDVLYISFDVDSLDPKISSGTGTPVPGGLSLEEAEALLRAFYLEPKTRVMEITEVNPLLDCGNKMAEAVVALLQNVLK